MEKRANEQSETVGFSEEYLEALSLIEMSNQADWLRKFARAAGYYILFENERYKESGLNRKEYFEHLGIAERSYYRYKKLAKLMRKYCEKYYPTGIAESFTFTREMLNTCFSSFFSGKTELSIYQLAEQSRTLEEFESFLSGEKDLSDKKIEQVLEGRLIQPIRNEAPIPAHKQNGLAKDTSDTDLIYVPHPDNNEENLFSTHEKIINAGFGWDREKGKYFNPDSSEITIEQLSEFVDDETGLKIFEEVRKVVAPARREVVSCIEQFRMYFLAYTRKNNSPKFTQLLKEKHHELEQEVLGILHEVSLMLRVEVD